MPTATTITLALLAGISPIPNLVMALVLGGRTPVRRGLIALVTWWVALAGASIALDAAGISKVPIPHGTWVHVLGVALVISGVPLAVRWWYRRRRTHTAGWVELLERPNPLWLIATTVVLASGNPKNLTITAAAAHSFTSLADSLVYATLGSLVLAAQVAWCATSESARTRHLPRLHRFVTRNEDLIGGIGLSVLGLLVIATNH